MIKFKDTMHEGTEDGFEIEVSHSIRKAGVKELYIRIYQEMDSGIVREIYLSHEDTKQINSQIIKLSREENL